MIFFECVVFRMIRGVETDTHNSSPSHINTQKKNKYEEEDESHLFLTIKIIGKMRHSANCLRRHWKMIFIFCCANFLLYLIACKLFVTGKLILSIPHSVGGCGSLIKIYDDETIEVKIKKFCKYNETIIKNTRSFCVCELRLVLSMGRCVIFLNTSKYE